MALTPAREEFTPIHDLAVAPVAGQSLRKPAHFGAGLPRSLSQPNTGKDWERDQHHKDESTGNHDESPEPPILGATTMTTCV